MTLKTVIRLVCLSVLTCSVLSPQGFGLVAAATVVSKLNACKDTNALIEEIKSLQNEGPKSEVGAGLLTFLKTGFDPNSLQLNADSLRILFLQASANADAQTDIALAKAFLEKLSEERGAIVVFNQLVARLAPLLVSEQRALIAEGLADVARQSLPGHHAADTTVLRLYGALKYINPNNKPLETPFLILSAGALQNLGPQDISQVDKFVLLTELSIRLRRTPNASDPLIKAEIDVIEGDRSALASLVPDGLQQCDIIPIETRFEHVNHAH